MFRDCTQITNKGEARYQLELVESNGWTLEEGFAPDVCRLPVKYRNGERDIYLLRFRFDILDHSRSAVELIAPTP